MIFRLRLSTLGRMRAVPGLSYSAIARRALRAFTGRVRVVALDFLEPTTRAESMAIQLRGLPLGLSGRVLDAVICWHLDRCGALAVVDRGGMRALGDGMVCCDAPADCVAGMPAALRAIRKRTLAIKA